MSKNVLWAPWRGAYITEAKPQECVFCKKLDENNDKANYVLYRGEKIFIVMNLFPYNNGHILLLPKRHVACVTELEEDEINEMGKLLKSSISIIKEVLCPQGFNVGYNLGETAGAGIAGHLHQHIVPRWKGDTNFMPVIAGLKVISQHIDITYDKLYNAFLAI